MLKIFINMFRLIKIKKKSFGISYRNHIFLHYYNNVITLLQTFLVILLCWYKTYSMCLIPFFDFYKLFPAFFCANNIESLVNNLFGVKIFNPFPFLLLLVVACPINLQIVLCRFFLLYQTILHFQTTYLNYILKEITFKDHEALPYTYFSLLRFIFVDLVY